MLCKIIGHKMPKQARDNMIRETGWIMSYNQQYNHHEVGYNCKRCQKMVPIGYFSMEKPHA